MGDHEIEHGCGAGDDVIEAAQADDISDDDDDDDGNAGGLGARKQPNHQSDQPSGEGGARETNSKAGAEMGQADGSEGFMNWCWEQRHMADGQSE